MIRDLRKGFSYASPLHGLVAGLLEGFLRQSSDNGPLYNATILIEENGIFRIKWMNDELVIKIERQMTADDVIGIIDGRSPAETETQGGSDDH